MTTTLGIVQVPANLEALRGAIGPERLSHVLLECELDLRAIKQAVAEVSSAGQSKLLFVLGRPGQGKTSLVESTPVYLADIVAHVLTPPPEYQLPLRDLPAWLSKELPAVREKSSGRFIVINLDGREIPTTDEVETQAAMGNMNAFLRNQQSLLALWPVNDEKFAATAIDRLRLAGGKSALVAAPVHRLVGLPRDRWMSALDLVLGALNVALADAALSHAEIDACIQPAETVGDFLRAVQNLVVSRYDLGELGAVLPRVYVVISSNDDIYDNCRLLRRGSKFLVDPDKLLQFSRANVAEDWRRRGKESPRRSLAFIASLFEVRLLNLSSSAVVNSCAISPDQDLPKLVAKHYNAKAVNAANAIKNSPLARSLRGEEDVGIAKSNPSEPIARAFRDIQKKTNAKHRFINEAIVRSLSAVGIDVGVPVYEHQVFPLSNRELLLRADVWIPRQGRPDALEFTYRADGDASTAVISSYVLGKVQDYARDYNLI